MLLLGRRDFSSKRRFPVKLTAGPPVKAPDEPLPEDDETPQKALAEWSKAQMLRGEEDDAICSLVLDSPQVQQFDISDEQDRVTSPFSASASTSVSTQATPLKDGCSLPSTPEQEMREAVPAVESLPQPVLSVMLSQDTPRADVEAPSCEDDLPTSMPVSPVGSDCSEVLPTATGALGERKLRHITRTQDIRQKLELLSQLKQATPELRRKLLRQLSRLHEHDPEVVAALRETSITPR